MRDYQRGVYEVDGQPMSIIERYDVRGNGPYWLGRWRVDGRYQYKYFKDGDPRPGARHLPGYRFPDRRTAARKRAALQPGLDLAEQIARQVADAWQIADHPEWHGGVEAAREIERRLQAERQK